MKDLLQLQINQQEDSIEAQIEVQIEEDLQEGIKELEEVEVVPHADLYEIINLSTLV